MLASIVTSVGFAGLALAQSMDMPVTGMMGNATVVSGNPVGMVYTATLPEMAFSYPGPQGNIRGSISAMANPDGVGLTWNVMVSNLPMTGGPFGYHLHVAPVGMDMNCTKTLAHLDPYVRGEDPVCDPALPETCQVGDLSGKHGKLMPDSNMMYNMTYMDKYTTTIEGMGSFFGNRSIVIHFANKTRITCANFVATKLPMVNGTSNETMPMPMPTEMPMPTQMPIPYMPGSAGTNNMASMLYVLGLAGLLAFFM